MARVEFESGVIVAGAEYRTAKELTPAQLQLLRIMSECQFGRIEQARPLILSGL
jgi:hypothetical protein